MGTRSLTHIHQDGKDSPVIATIYQQFDGYPNGVGMGIKNAGAMKIVNGYGPNDKAGTSASGMGCYAAQLISSLKSNIGGLYLYPANASDCGEEYTYNLWQESGEIHISVGGYTSKLSDFNPDEAESSDN